MSAPTPSEFETWFTTQPHGPDEFPGQPFKSEAFAGYMAGFVAGRDAAANACEDEARKYADVLNDARCILVRGTRDDMETRRRTASTCAAACRALKPGAA